jgi:5-methyltetrahydrofolate--homocysteine methyltransferase
MIIVGELINASRKTISKAIEANDTSLIQDLAVSQANAGADYIDVNAGIFVGSEPDYLEWLVQTTQEVVDRPCAIDSPDPQAIEAALKVHKGVPLINSISLEKERYNNLMPLIAGSELNIVALCMSDDGMPTTADDRLQVADYLVNALVKNGIGINNIYVDPLVQPISVDNSFGLEFLNAVEKIRKTFEGVHTICGLSNISYGLPNRKYLNQIFLSLAICKGLDTAIVNPLDKNMMGNIIATEGLLGMDPFCMQYLKAHRSGKFKLT